MTEQNKSDRHPENSQEENSKERVESVFGDPGPCAGGFGESSHAQQQCPADRSSDSRESWNSSSVASTFSALALIGIFTIGSIGAGAYFAIQKISQHDNVVARVVFEDKFVELNEGQIGEFNATVEDAISEKHEAAYANIQSEVHTQVDDLFERYALNVDEFVDWYYSLTGSTLRVGAWVLDDSDEYMNEQLADQVFGGEEFERDLLLVRFLAQQHLQNLEADVARHVNQKILDRFDARPQKQMNGAVDDVTEIKISDAVRQAVNISYEEDLERWQFSATVGGVAGGTAAIGPKVASRVISRSPRISAALARSWRQIAGLVGRRAGAAAVRGGVAMAATSWSGPGAAVVGAGVTVTSMAATEYGALQVQRRTAGPEMEDSLRTALEDVRADIKREITNGYRERVDRRVALVERTLEDRAIHIDDGGEFHVFGARAN